MRILLAESSAKMLNVLNLALGREPAFELVGNVMSTENLLTAAHDLQPDLVLVDWQLAKGHPQILFMHLHRVRPGLKVLAMVTHMEDGRAALAAGADACVSKSDPPDWLLDSVRRLGTKPGMTSD